jgi:hypothetical protein
VSLLGILLSDDDTRADSEVQARAEGWHSEWLNELRRAWGYADAYASTSVYDDVNASASVYTYAEAEAYDADANVNANAEADVDADADVDANADAYAHLYATVDAHIAAPHPQPTPGIPDMPIRPGLYLFTSPSSDSLAVLRVAWLRPLQGDEHEALNVVTPLRGEYQTMLSEAQDVPPPNWRWTQPLKRPTQYHRAQIRNPIALDPAGYAKICPCPADWSGS